MNETMYDRIKRMTPEEMRTFVYWVYLNGVRDGEELREDSLSGYFGGYVLNESAEELMPNGAQSLWDRYEKVHGEGSLDYVQTV